MTYKIYIHCNNNNAGFDKFGDKIGSEKELADAFSFVMDFISKAHELPKDPWANDRYLIRIVASYGDECRRDDLVAEAVFLINEVKGVRFSTLASERHY